MKVQAQAYSGSLASFQKQCAMFLFVGALLSAKVHALTPGPTFILECPECQQAVKYYSIGSGNTIGAKFWTDGKMDAPMLPDRSPIVKCPKCARLFWLVKAKQLATIENYALDTEGKQWEKTPQPIDPNEQELLALPNLEKLSREEQITVCRRAWWLANDRLRNNEPARKPNFSMAQVGNLKRLSLLLDEQKPAERVQKAEIARELGKFQECKRLLNVEFPIKNQKDADFIKNLADKDDEVVRQFP